MCCSKYKILKVVLVLHHTPVLESCSGISLDCANSSIYCSVNSPLHIIETDSCQKRKLDEGRFHRYEQAEGSNYKTAVFVGSEGCSCTAVIFSRFSFRNFVAVCSDNF